MATQQELQDQLDAVRLKRSQLSNQVQGLNDQHASSNSTLLGTDMAAMDKIRFNSALKPLLQQDRMLHQQEQQLIQAQNRANIAQRALDAAPAIAAKQAAAVAKAKADQQKIAAANLEDQSARAFGLGPKKGIDYVTQQGAFYDPSRGAIAVPDSKTAKTAAIKDIKGDPKAYSQVKDELSGFGKQAGVQGPISPESFFGPNGVDMEKNDDGDYVYNLNGTSVTIPSKTAERLQEQYNNSLPTTPEPGETPAGVKYIPTQAFQQANNALTQLKGPSYGPNPVDRYLASQSLNREVQPAVQEAVARKAQGTLFPPATVPSSGPQPGVPLNLPTGANILDQGAYNNSGIDPIFASIAAKNEQTRRAPETIDQEVTKRGGTVSRSDITKASDIARNVLGADATAQQLGVASKAALDQIALKNQASALDYRALTEPASVVGQVAQTAIDANPILAPRRVIQTGLSYLDPSTNPVVNSLLGAIPGGHPQQDKEAAAKQLIADRIRAAINPEDQTPNTDIIPAGLQ